ncbi:hemerythrin domain-containing protein [Caenimonas terrae]|uniref:Hemerythrin domain-containing protein n=1 Tax=Caenimonas terrae TaxID=696074 RepID=A0ABW0NDU9_9BURK
MSHPAATIIHEEHAAVAAMLRSLQAMVQQGPGEAPERFFDVVRAMLFYIDEFPGQRHHPKESNLLFPRVLQVCPELMPVIEQLESEHLSGEGNVRELQHKLAAWEYLGESRRPDFEDAARKYVDFYLNHMRVEERELLPAAERALSAADWAELDAAFSADRDPLAGGVREAQFDRLFTRIVLQAPAPIGVGPSTERLLPA